MPPSESKLHSDDFASGPFRPHGSIELWTEGNVVRLNARGPFNKEAVLAMHTAWRQLAASVPLQSAFADIVTVSDSMMAGPDVLNSFAQFLQANTSSDLVPCAIAWVVPRHVEGALLMIPLFEEAYRVAQRNVRFFEVDAEAVQWVKAQLQPSTTPTPDGATP